jgi:hypothetical protein
MAALDEATRTPTPDTCRPLSHDIWIGMSDEVLGQPTSPQDGEGRAVLTIGATGSSAVAVCSTVVVASRQDGFAPGGCSDPGPHLRTGIRDFLEPVWLLSRVRRKESSA